MYTIITHHGTRIVVSTAEEALRVAEWVSWASRGPQPEVRCGTDQDTQRLKEIQRQRRETASPV